jgi:hypothetical protein
VSVREHGKGDTGSVSSEDLTRALLGEIERREARAGA